ncbi:MAG: Txe/YoeB family addiction module toxin [Bacteroidales bacterium]|nr:Txe/YoeB family addiction module toxin [Bacteroidales bacterium]
MYELKFDNKADKDIERLKKSGDKQAIKRLGRLLDELKLHPRKGTGKPEPLRYKSVETWSRQITEKHRLVYEIFEEVVTVDVVNAYGHYGDK